MIDILSLKVLEPSTLITDIILGIVAIILSKKLFNNKNYDWGYFMLFMGLSAIIGSFGHGFSYVFGDSLKIISWIILNISILFAEKETLNFLQLKNKKLLKIAFIIQFIVFSALAAYFNSFTYIKISVVIGLLGFVMITNIITSFNTQRKYLVYGILVSLSSIFIHWKKISIDEQWFNHNDISHIITIFSILLMYKGVIKKINK